MQYCLVFHIVMMTRHVVQVPMAAALYYGEPIAIYMFRQDVEVAKVAFYSTPPYCLC